jgi:acetyl-CoA synthetase (ADP-forming)
MTSTLSEAQSKAVLAPFGVPFLPEHVVDSASDAAAAARSVGLPVVAKLCGDNIAHKTERGLVRLGLRTEADVRAATEELLALATPEDGEVSVLIAPMVAATREFIAGMVVDEQFGPTVLLGVGGVLAEAISDVVMRLVPITAVDALEMVDSIRTRALLESFRGEPAVDRDALAGVLLALSAAAVASPEIASIDINPLMITNGRPVAVDALVEVTR